MGRSDHMFQGKVILVVDDEADLREILREELSYEGAVVIEAANGVEALQKVKAQSVDVILSDIRMPGGDGGTLAREVRSLFSSYPILILITGFADLQIQEAFSLGADGYLTKPFQLEKAKNEIARHLQYLAGGRKGALAGRKLAVNEGLRELFDSQKAQVGRGGLSFCSLLPSLRLDEIVQFHFADNIQFEGMVRWVKSSESTDAKVSVGIEFIHLSHEAQQLFDSFSPGWNKLVCYIPNVASLNLN